MVNNKYCADALALTVSFDALWWSMIILDVLTATLAAFPTVLSHPGRVLLALALLSPKWALVLVCAVIHTTYCVTEETALGLFGYILSSTF